MKRLKKFSLWVLSLSLICSIIVMKNSIETNASSLAPTVEYKAHVANVGWQNYVSDGATAGTVGQSLRMEALQLKVNSSSGGITYRAHVANIGWQSWVSDDQIAGTTGKSSAIEAIEIKLTGTLATQYDVYYRLHCHNYGWLGWAKNGESAGTTGGAVDAQAIQVLLVPKITYEAHATNKGWLPSVSSGETAGTTGEARAMEAVKISPKISGLTIYYQAHVADKGWLSVVSSGEIAGTTGEARAMEAVKIYLDSNTSQYYDIAYRAHVAFQGWTSWVKNNELAGTTGKSKQMEAIQIKIVPKGSDLNSPSYYKLTMPEPPKPPVTQTTGSKIANHALSKNGSPYVYGGTGPNAFDCSGLAQWAHRQENIFIGRTVTNQYASGVSISKTNLQPGDLVFYITDGSNTPSHVGIYIGSGQFIHAGTPSTGVYIASMSNSYWSSRYVGARRYW